MKRSAQARPIQCARCGGSRLIPLTVHFARAKHRQSQRSRPVRAELKCAACGHRHVAYPSVLLAG